MARPPALGVGVGLAVLAAVVAVRAERAGDALPHDAPRLSVRLATAATLPPDAKAVMVDEVQRIWAAVGVRIDWVGPGVELEGRRSIRALVVSPASRTAAALHSWPIAELLRDDSGQPLAVASIDAARRVIDVAGHAHEPAAMTTRRLGMVLGRAIAHEIGHDLLATAAHASHGLMRTRISADDLVDLRAGGFGLDAGAAVAARRALVVAAASPLRLSARDQR